MGGQHVILNKIVRGSVKLIGPAFADLVEDNSADAVLGGERGGVDLQLGHILESRRIRILTMGERGRRPVGDDVAVGQIAIDRDFLTGIGGSLGAASVPQVGTAAGAGQQDGEVLPVLGDLGQRDHRF